MTHLIWPESAFPFFLAREPDALAQITGLLRDGERTGRIVTTHPADRPHPAGTVRAGERLRFPDRADSPTPGYFFEVLTFGATEKSMSAYLAEFPLHDGKEARPHFHSGAEFIYVLSGELAISYQGEDHLLEAGDSVYFDASEPHAYLGKAESGTKAIVVTSQPRL